MDRRRPACRAARRCTTCATRPTAGCPTSTTSARKITPRTKGIVVINPNNPTGALYSRRAAQEHRRRSRASTAWSILADEVYDKVLYDGVKHTAHRQPVDRRADAHLQLAVQELPLLRLPRRLDGGVGRQEPRRRLHRGPEHALEHAAVRQRAGPVGDPDRAGRLPEHQRPGRRRAGACAASATWPTS